VNGAQAPRVAFYAPLKPPDRGAPSGDQRIAQLLMTALRASGSDVHIAARLRSRESRGDGERQLRIKRLGERWANRLVRRYLNRPARQRPQLWFTYHLYYKAPDWLGPTVSEALNIPYVVAEASHAPKRDKAPWQMVHRAAADAIRAADAIITINSDDLGGLRQLVHEDRMLQVPPFIELSRSCTGAEKVALRTRWANRLGVDQAVPWLVCVAMMRAGDKLASYKLLGRALTQLQQTPWHLLVVGDGGARDAVEEALAPVSARVTYTGQLPADEVSAVLSASDMYVWPAVNEAFGLALIEAQAAGLPVVAANIRGVPDVVSDGLTGLLGRAENVEDIATNVAALLGNPERRRRMGDAARRRAERCHGIEAAADVLGGLMRSLTQTGRHESLR
jgi:glycosyltransferase involved in cell wall biosynthesis